MKNKKIVYIGAVFFTMILVSSFVSAGIVDWVKEIFGGEVKESPFEASVQLQNAPPIIVTVLNIKDNDVPGSPVNSITPVKGIVNNAEVRFVAQDNNGVQDLPGGTGSTETITLATATGDVDPSAGTSGKNVEVYVTEPIFSTNAIANGCVEVAGCPNCPGAVTTNRREYRCTVPIDYYSKPGAAWKIKVAIADPGNGVGADNAKTFTYNTLSAFDITNPVAGLLWTAVSVSVGNDDADNDPLGLTNRGNVDLTVGSITGKDLKPDGGAGGSDLPVTAFAVSTQTAGIPLAECCKAVGGGCAAATANALATTPVTISAGGAVSLPFGNGAGGPPPVDNEKLYFCLWEKLSDHVPTLTLSASSYSAKSSNTPPNPWDLVLS